MTKVLTPPSTGSSSIDSSSEPLVANAAMNADSPHVGEEETVLRRIHHRFYDAGQPIAIQPEAFRPTTRDEDGLSVFRERFTSPALVIAAIEEGKRHQYYIARLTVRDLVDLDLTVVP